MQSQRWSFFFVHDPERDFPGGIFGPAFNTIGRYDFVHAQVDRYALDGQTTAQEPVFAPRGTEAAEGAGWLWVLVNRHETMLNDLLIFDAGDLAGGLSVLKALRNALPHEKFI